MMSNHIITIGREVGSGGREIGERLAREQREREAGEKA